MNSSYSGNRPQRTATSSSAAAAASYDSYQFDFGLGSNRNSSSSRPLRDQKPSLGTAPTPSTKPSVPWTHQPSKPSWTHQPVAGAAAGSGSGSGSGSAGSASMVGDIFGKSWGSAAPAASSSRLGIPESNPNLFGDLLGSALGSGRSASNVPLKAAAPASKNSFSMGKLSDSLPKSTASGIGSNAAMGTTWGSADSVGKVSSFGQGTGMIGNPMASGGQPMKSASGMAGSTPMNSKKDPFGSLMDFGSKPATKAPSVSSNSAKSSSSGGADSTFGSFHNANSTKINDFGMPSQSFTSRQPSQQPDPVKSGVDPLDMLFSSTTTPAPAPANAKGVSESEMFSEMNDWDTGAEFGGHDDGGTTTELEGLPPPPAGVTVSAAKTKGMDNYKQGQFADAIKWLSWAVVLLGKSGDNAATTEVLSCRASSYKEVGEYKKAIADCSKVLEYDKENVSVLLQRALLYESTEKYRLDFCPISRTKSETMDPQDQQPEHEYYGADIPDDADMDADYEIANPAADEDPDSKPEDIEEMKKRLKEIEEEAGALREMQAKVEKEMGSSAAQDSSTAAATLAEKEEVDSRSIYVGNVDYACTPEEVQQHFQSCGTVNRVTILTDKFGQPKGFAYVEFVEVDAVQNALLLNESELHGRQLKVSAKRTNVPGMKQYRGRRPSLYGAFRSRRPYMPSPFYSPFGKAPRFRRPMRYRPYY